VNLLLDTCIYRPAAVELAAAGHDVVSAAAWWPVDPGDAAILQTAYAEGRVLVILDKDFGRLAVVEGLSHPGIVRLVGLATTERAAACIAALARHEDDLRAGAIVTVERRRTRVRRPPDDG
jgi:predicted nuclease of predicted toxin-antitoxin system